MDVIWTEACLSLEASIVVFVPICIFEGLRYGGLQAFTCCMVRHYDLIAVYDDECYR